MNEDVALRAADEVIGEFAVRITHMLRDLPEGLASEEANKAIADMAQKEMIEDPGLFVACMVTIPREAGDPILARLLAAVPPEIISGLAATAVQVVAMHMAEEDRKLTPDVTIN